MFRRFLLLLFCFLAASSGRARADWKSDATYLKQLKKKLSKLQVAVALFERHRRSLEMVEAEIANVELGLADPRGKPVELVREVLKKSFPKVTITMSPLVTAAPKGIGIWRWRCKLTGDVGELRWATQLMRQKGLFIVPGTREPVRLDLQPSQLRGTLTFVGHHIRLRDSTLGKLPLTSGGSDIFASRTDHLAMKIKKLQAKVAALRTRVVDIQGFEARVTAIKKYIQHLRHLARSAKDPFRAITPLLDLELINFQTILLIGDRVTIRGQALSTSARDAARRWIVQLARKKTTYQLKELELRFKPPSTAALPLTKGGRGSGPRVQIHAAGARPIDLVRAGSRRAAVVMIGTGAGGVSGTMKDVTIARAIPSAARILRQAALQEGRDWLILPRKKARIARRSLKASPRHRRGRKMKMTTAVPCALALTLLQNLEPDILEAPRAAIVSRKPVQLMGKTRIRAWLRLLAAGMGLMVDGGTPGTVQLRRTGKKAQALRPVPETLDRAVPDRSVQSTLPLNQLQVRLIVLKKRGGNLAILTDSHGTPLRVRRGKLLGKNRSQVVRIDPRGLTLLWSGAGVTRRVLLPIGDLKKRGPM